MTLSEIYYNAACRMTRFRDDWGCFSCELVTDFGGEKAMLAYSWLMASKEDDFLYSTDVLFASEKIGWDIKDFRTFMLLMASEAVKC